MAISYQKLFDLLNEKGVTTYYLRQNKIIGQQTYYNLKNGKGNLGTESLEKLCKLLNCQPGDLMEYIQDSNQEAVTIMEDAVQPPTTSNQPTTGSKVSSIRAFTPKDENTIDSKRLASDIIYQIEIQDTYGNEVLANLLDKVRNQEIHSPVD